MNPAESSPQNSAARIGLAEWRAIIDRSIAPLEIDAIGPDPFEGSLEVTMVDRVAVFDLAATAHMVRRTPALIERSPAHYYKLSLLGAGEMRISQDGRSVDLTPGDLTIYDTSRPYKLLHPCPSEELVIMFPHSFVALPAEDIARVTAVPFPRTSPIGRVINPFFAALGDSISELRTGDSIRLIHTALDLLVTLLSTELLGGVEADPRRTLIRDIRAWIDEHLADGDLTPTRIAREHFISARHLHGLFSSDGTSVSRWIRERRLEHIRRDIGDPLLAAVSLSTLAARWGLRDAAHFSKLFRAEFGITPREYRMRSFADRSGPGDPAGPD